MAIGSISLQGQITRAQDFSTIKQNEDNKPFIDQGNFQAKFEKEVNHNLNRVRESEDPDNQGKKHDAKEKSNAEYSGDGGKRRQPQRQDGHVQLKMPNSGGFDIKI